MSTNRETMQAQRIREQQLASNRGGTSATSRGVQSGVRKQLETYQASNAIFEQTVNSPSYPPELKAAYDQGKASNNFNTFNAAVEQYNAAQKASFEARKEAQNAAQKAKEATSEQSPSQEAQGQNTNEEAEQRRYEYEQRVAKEATDKAQPVNKQPQTDTQSTVGTNNVDGLVIQPQEFHELEKTGKVEYVERTTNPDKFVVRVAIPDKPGQYIPTYLTRDEVLARGGEIPVEGNVWGIGGQAKMVQPGQGNTVQSIAKELDIPEAQVQNVLDEFKNNPYKPEFLTTFQGGVYTPEQRTRMFKLINRTADKNKEQSLEENYLTQQKEQFKIDNVLIGKDIPVPGGQWISKKTLETIQKESPDLARILENQGVIAYTTAVTYRNELSKAAWEAWKKDHDNWLDENIKNDEYLNDVLEKEGEEAAINAYNKRQIDLQATNERWIKENIMTDDELAKIFNGRGLKEALEAYDKKQQNIKITIEKQISNSKEVDDALEIFAPYKQGSKYNVYQALMDAFQKSHSIRTGEAYQEQFALINAAETLFPADVLAEMKMTNPWLFEKRGDIGNPDEPKNVFEAFKLGRASLPIALVATARDITSKTPIPHDDMFLAALLGVAGLGAGVGKAIQYYTNKRDKGEPQSVAIIDENNKATLIDPKLFFPPGGIRTYPAELKRDFPMEQILVPHIPLTQEQIKAYREAYHLEQYIPANIKAVMILPTPAENPTAREMYLLSATAKLEKAEKAIGKSLPSTQTIPVNYEKILEQANVSERKKMFDSIDKYIRSIPSQGSETGSIKIKKYETAHEEYLRKYKIWLAAWKSYVQSVHPEPIKGSITPAVKANIAISLLNQRKPKVKVKEGYVRDADTDVNSMTATKSKTSSQTALKNLTKSKTQTQKQTAVKSSLKQSTKTATQQRTATKTQTKTQTQTQVKQATKTALQEATDEMTRPGEITRTKTGELTRTLTRNKIKLPKGKGKTDKEKRAIIKERGLTTYNMGKLHGKDVWWTHLDTGENVVVLGEKPEGATLTADGRGSADKTTQRIGNLRDFKPFSIRHGAVVSRVTPSKSPKGASASFGPSSPSAIGKSRKMGKMYVTELGSSKMLGFSAKPLGRRRHKR